MISSLDDLLFELVDSLILLSLYLIPSSPLPSKNAIPLAPHVADINIFSSVDSIFLSSNNFLL